MRERVIRQAFHAPPSSHPTVGEVATVLLGAEGPPAQAAEVTRLSPGAGCSVGFTRAKDPRQQNLQPSRIAIPAPARPSTFSKTFLLKDLLFGRNATWRRQGRAARQLL
jgi:hypothetical protein